MTRSRRIAFWAAVVLCGLTGLAAAAGTAAAWRLAQAPLGIGVLNPYIEGLARRLAGIEIYLENTRLAWSADDGVVEARLYGVRLLQGDRLLLEAPEVALGFSPIQLASTEPFPTHIAIRGARFGEFRGEGGDAPDPDGLFAALAPDAALGRIEQIRLDDASLTLPTPVGPAALLIERAEWRRRGDTADLVVAGFAALDALEATVSGHGVMDANAGRAAVSLNATGPDAGMILAKFFPDAPLARIDAPVNGRLDLALDRSLGLTAAAAVEIGAGDIAAPGAEAPVLRLRGGSAHAGLTAPVAPDRLDGLTAADLTLAAFLDVSPPVRGAPDIGVSLTRAAGADHALARLDAEDADFGRLPDQILAVAAAFGVDVARPDMRLDATGDLLVTAEITDDLRARRVDARLDAGEGAFVAPAIYPDPPIALDAVTLRATAEDDFTTIRIDALDLALARQPDQPEAATPRLSVTGAAERDGDGVAAVTLRVEGGGLSMGHYRDLWPYMPQNTSREWMRERMTAGRITALQGAFDLVADGAGGLDLDRADATFTVEDLSLIAADGLTPLTGLHGEGRLDGMTLVIDAKAGGMRDARVTTGTVTFPDLAADPPVIAIEAGIDSPVADVLAVLDDPALGYLGQVGLSADGARGRAVGSLALSFPMVRDLKFDGVELSAEAELSGMGLRDVVGAADLSGVSGAFRVGADALTLSGAGRLEASPVSFAWREGFADGPGARRIEAQGVIDDDTRAAIGLGDIAPYIAGPVTTDLVLTASRSGPNRIEADLGLDQATLTVAEIDWSKPAGAGAQANVDLRVEGGELVAAPRLALNAPGLVFEGGYTRGAAPAEGRVTGQTLRFGRTALNRLDVRFTPDAVTLAAAGPALDVAAFRNDDAGDDGPIDFAPDMPVALDAKVVVDRVWIAPDAPPLERAAVDFSHSGTDWRRLELAALAPGGGAILMDFDPDRAEHPLALRVDDIGATGDALGMPKRVRGGRLALWGDMTPSGALAGRFDATDLRLVDAPIMARALQIASLTGVLETLAGPGLNFSSIGADWRYGDGVLSLDGGRANNLSLGLTFNGDVNLDASTLAMRGTLAPVNILNRAIEAIPLLGDLLSPRGEGVFAFSYTAQGPLDDPEVSANPLTALAPGMLRDLFPDAPIDQDGG